MTTPEILDDDAFLAAFHACRLPASAFDHRAHLRVAWLLLRRLPRDEAIERACDGIARLAAHLGATTKYNRTRSEALMRLMAHGGATAASIGWGAFLQRNEALLADARGALARHYSADVLDSAAARERFVLPDRQPLPE